MGHRRGGQGWAGLGLDRRALARAPDGVFSLDQGAKSRQSLKKTTDGRPMGSALGGWSGLGVFLCRRVSGRWSVGSPGRRQGGPVTRVAAMSFFGAAPQVTILGGRVHCVVLHSDVSGNWDDEGCTRCSTLRRQR